jgi:hypothetical protein
MKYVSSLAIALALLSVTLMSAGASAAVPLTMTHQGRLLDAADQPVNDVFDITYRIFEVPSGGSPLWTEVHSSVQVTDGLFSALLGSTVPLSPDVLGNGGGGALSPRYLEVSIGGTALSPRLALSSVPSALSSSHVTGDIETSPGRVAVGDLDGDGFLDFSSTADQSELHITRKRPGRVKYSNLTLRVMPDSLSDYRDTDSDDDGVPESEFSQRLTPTTSSVAIKTKGTGASNAKTASLSAISSIPFAGGASASLACTVDDDGDGVPETSVSSSCDASSASQVMEKKGLNAVNVKLARTISSPPGGLLALDALDMDSDDDGVMDKSVSSSLDATGARLNVTNIGSSGQDGVELLALPTGSSVAIKEKGTGADRNRITSTTSPEAATVLLEADLDGDGVMDNTSADSVGAGGASRRLAVHNIGSSGQDGVEVKWAARPKGGIVKVTATQNSQSLRCSTSADSAAATMLIDADLDGDGLADRSISSSCDATSARLKVNNIGSSGNDGVELSVLPTTSSMAIKTKGTGAAHNRTATVSSSTDESNASVVCDIDDDGDGVPESEISQLLTPTTSSMAIKTKGTGADKNRSASLVCATDIDGDGTFDRSVSTTADSTTAGIAIDESGVQVAMKVVNKGVVKGAINISNINRMIELDSDGDGFFDHGVGVGVDPTHRIDVAGGAYCDGTNWVNASDRNSKENFTSVDGNELLDQIAQLSITRWNYKGNNQAEHIGPTAQDFKAAFGVGADDKSISTIDPSGIALAAIKALNSKVQELNAKTEEIAQLKAELDAIKAMLVKQAATKN